MLGTLLTILVWLLLASCAAVQTVRGIAVVRKLCALQESLQCLENRCQELGSGYSGDNRCDLPLFHSGPHRLGDGRSTPIWFESYAEKQERIKASFDVNPSRYVEAVAKLAADKSRLAPPRC